MELLYENHRQNICKTKTWLQSGWYWNVASKLTHIWTALQDKTARNKFVFAAAAVVIWFEALLRLFAVKCRCLSTLEMRHSNEHIEKRNLFKALQIHYGLWTRFFSLFFYSIAEEKKRERRKPDCVVRHISIHCELAFMLDLIAVGDIFKRNITTMWFESCWNDNWES